MTADQAEVPPPPMWEPFRLGGVYVANNEHRASWGNRSVKALTIAGAEAV